MVVRVDAVRGKEAVFSMFLKIRKNLSNMDNKLGYKDRALSLLEYIEDDFFRINNPEIASMYFDAAELLFTTLYTDTSHIESAGLFEATNNIYENLEKKLSKKELTYLDDLHKLICKSKIVDILKIKVEDIYSATPSSNLSDDNKRNMRRVLTQECTL